MKWNPVQGITSCFLRVTDKFLFVSLASAVAATCHKLHKDEMA